MKKPEHCRNCMSLSSHGNKILTPEQKRYNNWCCAKGAPAEKSIGWCKTHGKNEQNNLHEIFSGQLPEKLHVKSLVTFYVPSINGPDQVISWKANELESILDEYVFIEKLPKKLPRFKKK